MQKESSSVMESEENKQKDEQTAGNKDSLNPSLSSVSNFSLGEEEALEEQNLEHESIESIREYADRIEQEVKSVSDNNLRKRKGKSKLWRIIKILLVIAILYFIWVFIKNFQQKNAFYSFIHDIPFIGKFFADEDITVFDSSSPEGVNALTKEKGAGNRIENNLSMPQKSLIQNSFADLVGNANQSVVSITTRGYVSSDKSITKDGNIDSLYAFFINDYRNKKYRGLGSGFVISQNGYIVTNYHVVRDVEYITVHFLDGRFYNTKLDSYDEISDIALLKVEGTTDLPALQFGDSNKVRAGDWILAVGNPFGLGFSVSFGVISAKDRFISRSFIKFLQTDAAINRGNSGGPMINMLGEVIGINTAMASNNGGSVGVGFAIPSNQASYIISQLKEHGRVLRGWLGVKITEIDKHDNIIDVITKEGVLVYQVLPNSPAEEIGLKKGDVIYKLNDVTIDNIATFASVLMSSNIGDSMEVYYSRGDKKAVVRTILGAKQKDKKSQEPVTNKQKVASGKINESQYTTKINKKGNLEKQQNDVVVSTNGQHLEGMGIKFAELKGSYVKDFGFDQKSKGVVIIEVSHNGVLNPNLRPGLLLRKVNNIPVENINSLEKAMSNIKEEENIIFLLEDNKGNKFFISKQSNKKSA